MNFKVGDTVLVEIPSEAEHEVYNSRIIKIRGNEIALAMLQQQRQSALLNYQDPLRLTVIKHDAVYEFIAYITHLGYSHFFISLPPTIIRKQRRYEVRVTAKFPVEVLYTYQDGTPVAAYLTSSTDLSAGGIKILTPVQYPTDMLLRLILNLPEHEEFYLSGLVIRTGPLERQELGNPYSHWAALKFQQISEQQRKKIRKFIYRWQELRVKSLI